MAPELSPLYPILDASYLPASTVTGGTSAEESRRRVLTHVVQSLAAAGVTMLQYRNKLDSDVQVLRDTIWLREQAPRSLRILLNDRAHLVCESTCDGVHVGQQDLSPDQARALIGPNRIVGLSTHTDAQILAGAATSADYLAIGPVYPTGSKPDAEAPVGLEGIRRARSLTCKPLVAIGGITLARAPELRAAGADSLAVISALFGRPAQFGTDPTLVTLEKLAKDFLHIFR